MCIWSIGNISKLMTLSSKMKGIFLLANDIESFDEIFKQQQ